jgi:hypothetical protein
MTNAIEIKFVTELKGFAVHVDGVAVSKGYGLKENAVYAAKSNNPGAKVAVYKRNGEFQKFA